jgi:sigma-B regulation protein RsbU (phosphoserine phosphatase)
MEQFVTFFLGKLDESSLTLSFSNAGHNYPFVSRQKGPRAFLETGGLILGMFDGADFQEDRVTLAEGDRLVLYTDGINEAVNGNGDEYGEERLYEIVQTAPGHLSARELVEHILEDHRAFLDGAEAQDDVTVMVLRVFEPDPAPRDPGAERVGADAR